MREIVLILTAVLLLGCTASEEPQEPAPIVQEPPDEVPLCSGPVCGSDGITYETDCDALDAAVQSFTIGECPEIEEPCNETDGGIESSVFGSVAKGNVSYDDFCEDSSILIEYTCVENEIKNSSISCTGMCVDGECIELEPEVNDTCMGPLEKNIYVTDTVTVTGVNYTDVCVDFKTVKDFYCKDNNVTAANTNCEPGERCDGGKCVALETVCTETDDGKDVYLKGKTTQYLGLSTTFNEWDDCDDQGTVIEHYCDENATAVTEYIVCESGYKCAAGKCVKGSCSDSDEGHNIFRKGTTRIDDKEYRDNCLSDYKLREYYCYGDDVEVDDLTCPEGYICDNDRCVEGYIN